MELYCFAAPCHICITSCTFMQISVVLCTGPKGRDFSFGPFVVCFRKAFPQYFLVFWLSAWQYLLSDSLPIHTAGSILVLSRPFLQLPLALGLFFHRASFNFVFTITSPFLNLTHTFVCAMTIY